jgi:hypothetical protein
MADPQLFGRWFVGPSWNVWRAVLKAAFAIPMTVRELQLFRTVADRDPPERRVRELWVIAGRRGGKDSIASLIAASAAAFTDYTPMLRPGERASILCLAVDRQQARIALDYSRAYFEQVPLLCGLVERETADGLELTNGAEIVVSTNSFRAVRGRSIACAIFDEVAFWRDEASATPDKETYTAIQPAMAMLPGSMLIGISSPYRKAGLLYDKWREHYGKAGDVLVIRAPSRTMNPLLPQQVVDDAYAADPASASAEFGAQFRDDIGAFVTREVIDSCTVTGRYELSPISNVRYAAFCDPSGGVSDSMTLGIAHRKEGRVVLDVVREARPPFSPERVTDEFATLLKQYRIASVRGDRYGGEWPREQFRKHGIAYELSLRTASDTFRDFLPKANSGQIELLDLPRLTKQLCDLERRTSRISRDNIGHPPGGHDDVAVAAAGALLEIGDARPPMQINPDVVEQLRARWPAWRRNA